MKTDLVNPEKLINKIVQFNEYIVERDGYVNFQDRNTFLGREENYKSKVAVQAQDALKYESWNTRWITNGKISERALNAVKCGKNLIYINQKYDFADKLFGVSKDEQKLAAKILFNIYKSREGEERTAFEDAKAYFGGHYDTIAYLFFIKDPSRFLPISTGHFEKSLRLIGCDYKLSGQCGWDNYIGFIDIIKQVQEEMIRMMPDVEIRLIDAYSFLWVIGEDARPTDFLNWKPGKNTRGKIERTTEKAIAERAQGKGGKTSHTSISYNRSAEVVRITKNRANGKCELCDKPAPFDDRKGDPYLEAHHIKWLSDGGEDSTDNTAALCPNCHTKMHVLDMKEDVEKLLSLRKVNN